jgi:hypothetical protein
MEEQQELMKRAVEAYEELNQREKGKKFFTWFEETFCVKNYEKVYVDNYYAAKVDDLSFVWTKSEEMSATVYGTCKFCGLHSAEQNKGKVVRTLEELGQFSSTDDNGTFYLDCGEHHSLDIEDEQSAIEESEIHTAEQKKSFKQLTTGKRESLMIYFNGLNYDLFEEMYIKTTKHIRLKTGNKLKETNVGEVAIMIVYEMFKKDPEAFLSSVEAQIEKSESNIFEKI